MPAIKWFGGGCGFLSICDQYTDDKMNLYLAEREVISKRLDLDHHHNSIPKEEYNDYLDPLIIPLVDQFNKLEIKTITCCQGRPKYGNCPYIFFYADTKQILKLGEIIRGYHRLLNEGWFWTNIGIIFEGERDNQATWIINFYDNLEMLRFTKEMFGTEINFTYPIYNWRIK